MIDVQSGIWYFYNYDPIGYYDSMNLYQYCGNNPVNWIDPWGLRKEEISQMSPEEIIALRMEIEAERAFIMAHIYVENLDNPGQSFGIIHFITGGKYGREYYQCGQQNEDLLRSLTGMRPYPLKHYRGVFTPGTTGWRNHCVALFRGDEYAQILGYEDFMLDGWRGNWETFSGSGFNVDVLDPDEFFEKYPINQQTGEPWKPDEINPW